MSTRKPAHRRDFLKASAAAAGAATVAGLTPTAFAAGNDTIKVGVIGCGGRGMGAVGDILNAEKTINGDNPKVEIVAVADVFKRNAEGFVRAMKSDDPKAYERRAANKLNLRPVTVPTAEKWSHVVRGGSWADKPDRLRSAARRGSDKSWMKHDPQLPQSIWWLTDAEFVGFRVVRPLEEYDNLKNLRSKVTRESK